MIFETKKVIYGLYEIVQIYGESAVNPGMTNKACLDRKRNKVSFWLPNN